MEDADRKSGEVGDAKKEVSRTLNAHYATVMGRKVDDGKEDAESETNQEVTMLRHQR